MSVHDMKTGFPYLGRGIALRNSYISTLATSIHGQVSESRSLFGKDAGGFGRVVLYVFINAASIAISLHATQSYVTR